MLRNNITIKFLPLYFKHYSIDKLGILPDSKLRISQYDRDVFVKLNEFLHKALTKPKAPVNPPYIEVMREAYDSPGELEFDNDTVWIVNKVATPENQKKEFIVIKTLTKPDIDAVVSHKDVDIGYDTYMLVYVGYGYSDIFENNSPIARAIREKVARHLIDYMFNRFKDRDVIKTSLFTGYWLNTKA